MQQTPSAYGDAGGVIPEPMALKTAGETQPGLFNWGGEKTAVTGNSGDPAWLTALVSAGQQAAVDVIGQVAGAVTGRKEQAKDLAGSASGQAKSVATVTTAPAWKTWLPWLAIAAGVAALFWFLGRK